MKPIVLETTDGKASMTKEDLEQIIKDSYNEGFEDGQRSMNKPITHPVQDWTITKDQAKKMAGLLKDVYLHEKNCEAIV